MISFIYDPEFAISFFLSILGIIFSLYIYLIERKFRQISYTFKTTNVLLSNPNLEKLSFSYDGVPLSSISITDVIIWSNGKEIIDRCDIAPLSPLTVHSSSKILDYQMILSNEPCNNFHLAQMSDTSLSLDFDFLGKNNGIAIRIIHSGGCSDFSVTCKLKDGKKTVYRNPRKGFFYAFMNNKCVKYMLSKKITSFVLLVFTVFLFPNAFIQSANYANNNYFGFPSDSIFMNLDSLIIFILCICSFLLSVPHIYNLFKRDPVLMKKGCDVLLCCR